MPDIRRWRSTAGGTLTAGTVSGYAETLGNVEGGYPLAVPAVFYTGMYALHVRVRQVESFHSTPLAVTLSAKIGGQLLSTNVTLSGRNGDPADPWDLVPVGVVSLPDVIVAEGSGRTIAGSIWVTNADQVNYHVEIDEGWLLSVDGNTLLVDMSTETDLWIEPPTVDQPRGGVWVNTTDDRGAAYGPGLNLRSLSRFAFEPPTTTLFVMTAGADDPTLEATYRPAWHTNAAR